MPTSPAQPDEKPGTPLVLVSGSGRSGTSSLAGALKRLGLHVPQPEDEPTETLSQQCERFFKLADIKGTA